MIGARRLRVLLYSLNYAPELTGVGKYSGELAEWLAAKGHEVRVICGPPYYPQWRVASGYRWWCYATESLAGVRVWRCPVWVPRRPRGVTRLVHLFSFVVASTPVLIRQALWKPDVVLAMEPPFMGAPMVLLTARLSKAKVWLHVQDLEVDAAFALGLLPAGWVSRLAFGLERRIKRAFTAVSTISLAMATRLKEKLGTAYIPSVFPNWIDSKTIRPLERPSVLRRELGLAGDTMIALYAGNMGAKQGLELVVKAAKELASESKLVFVFCGEGVAAESLRQETAGMGNVLWLPLQPFERLNELLNLADIHLLPQRADAADLVMPSKLTGMMASGRPVVAAAHLDTEIGRSVAQGGRITPPGELAPFTGAIRELAADRALREQLGKVARVYAVEHWEKDQVLGRFEDTIIDLVWGAGQREEGQGAS